MFSNTLALNPGKQASIDLHGVKCKSAKELIIKKLKRLSELNVVEVTVITGRGNHINANGSRGVLFKAFPGWIKSPELKYIVKNYVKHIGHYTVYFNTNLEVDVESKIAGDFFESPTGKLISSMAKERLEKDVKNGNPESQGLLGIFYITNALEFRNIPEGIRLLKLAKDKGDQLSQLFIAQAHCSGKFSDFGIKKDHKKSVELFLKAIAGKNRNHSRESHFQLGKAYFLGVGATQNDSEAIYHITIAANEGHPWAQLTLGEVYESGMGVGVDNHLANEWYSKAANQGLLEAQIKLADKYATGDGVTIDSKKSIYWRLKSALAGHAESQHLVGVFYSDDKNDELAYKWYYKAALQNHIGAKLSVAYDALFGQPYALEAVDLGWKWLQESVEAKHPHAIFILSSIYQVGNQFVSKDMLKALKLLRESADLGCIAARKFFIKHKIKGENEELNPDATLRGSWVIENAMDFDMEFQFSLGNDFENTNSFDNAMLFYSLSAEKDYIPAQLKLYSIYSTGKHVEKNDAEASKWIQRAADLGNEFAEYVVGHCYANGIYGFEEDDSKAYDWLLKSANQGNTKAQIGLADLIIQGSGTKAEKREQATKWLQLAHDNGDSEARLMLVGIDKLVSAFHKKNNVYSKKRNYALDGTLLSDKAEDVGRFSLFSDSHGSKDSQKRDQKFSNGM
jgi:TPR repeat protein